MKNAIAEETPTPPAVDMDVPPLSMNPKNAVMLEEGEVVDNNPKSTATVNTNPPLPSPQLMKLVDKTAIGGIMRDPRQFSKKPE